jgi:hypothetical protein
MRLLACLVRTFLVLLALPLLLAGAGYDLRHDDEARLRAPAVASDHGGVPVERSDRSDSSAPEAEDTEWPAEEAATADGLPPTLAPLRSQAPGRPGRDASDVAEPEPPIRPPERGRGLAARV